MMSKKMFKKMKNENECNEKKYSLNQFISFKHSDDANNLRLRFGNTKNINQYHFEYLVNPILFKFNQCVRLKNTKHAIKIVDIQTEDSDVLSKILRRLHGGLRLRKNEIFVTRTNALFVGYEGEYMDPTRIDDKDFLIELEIEGYKTNDKGFPSPIWSLVTARQSCDCL